MRSRLRALPVCWAVGAAWVSVALAAALGAHTRALAWSPGATWWRGAGSVLWSALAHTSWGHLAVNLVLWALFAPRVERAMGPWVLAVLVPAQLAAVAAHAVWGHGALAGGSFLVAAAMGAYVCLPWRDLLRTAAAAALLVLDALALAGPPTGTSHRGHLVAAALGAVAACVFRRLSPRADLTGD